MIHIYTGSGKGKTTAALGLALRAAGAGLKVYIVQFAKGRACSELKALKKFQNIKVEQFGTCRFIRRVSEKDVFLARKGFSAAMRAAASKKFDLIILDELTLALSLNLLSLEDVFSFIKRLPKKLELVVTGRDAPAELVKRADLVSDIREVKHYYKSGVLARKGIEF